MERHKPTVEDGQRSLGEHVTHKAELARHVHGPVLDAGALLRVLSDPEIVRYPVRLHFGAEELRPGEFAWVQPRGPNPGDGYLLHVHPSLRNDDDLLVHAVAYYIPTISYGEIVTSTECELFGAALLGVDVHTYYRRLVELSDQLAASDR